MLEWVRELDRRDRVLARSGWFFVALLVAMLVAAAFDSRQVLGINVWVKPIKFAASIAIYLWTLAWLFGYLRAPAWTRGLIRWGASLAMLAEIALIAGQSLRGTASHFNNTTALDSAAFSLMGLFILFNTALEILVLIYFLRPYPALAPAYLLGIRLGLAGAILSAAVGGMMIAHGAHTVGGADGGPGLWLVNWSTQHGDLRVAHAVGLHALQILPLVGYTLGRIARPRASVRATAVVAALYGATFAWLLWQAIEARPLVSANILS
jgi:hypothetical protein